MLDAVRQSSDCDNVRQMYLLHPQRSACMEKFFAEQAAFYFRKIGKPEGASAELHISLIEEKIETKMCGLDGALAAVMLYELDQVRARLCEHLAKTAPGMLEGLAVHAIGCLQVGHVHIKRRGQLAELRRVVSLSRSGLDQALVRESRTQCQRKC